MQGRLLGIKKSIWLLISLFFNILLFLFGSIFFALVYNLYDFWFYLFCFCVGCHLIFKSFLFKYDSACYFGVTLALIGIFYFYSLILNLLYLYPVFVVLAFSISSLVTYYFYKQQFQFFLFLSLFFVTIGLLFFMINLISIWIFLAIIGVSVILLILRFCLLK